MRQFRLFKGPNEGDANASDAQDNCPLATLCTLTQMLERQYSSD